MLLKGAENISDKRPRRGKKSERERLNKALEMNQPLATAYYLKEDLRMLWREATPKTGRRYLRDWISQAEASGLKEIQKMADTLRRHRQGILAYFRLRITSGPMEGMNNKVKVLLRKTYGLRDEEYLVLRLKGLHKSEVDLRERG